MPHALEPRATPAVRVDGGGVARSARDDLHLLVRSPCLRRSVGLVAPDSWYEARVPVEFTVGIPSHNRGGTVFMALATARSSRARPPARVLVVADGCTDGTQDAVRGLGEELVEVIDRPKGLPARVIHTETRSWNEPATGIVAWLGDDDLWLPDHLEQAGEHSTPTPPESSTRQPAWSTRTGCSSHWGSVQARAPTYRRRFLGIENRTPSSAVSHLAPRRRSRRGAGRPTWIAPGDWDLHGSGWFATERRAKWC